MYKYSSPAFWIFMVLIFIHLANPEHLPAWGMERWTETDIVSVGKTKLLHERIRCRTEGWHTRVPLMTEGMRLGDNS